MRTSHCQGPGPVPPKAVPIAGSATMWLATLVKDAMVGALMVINATVFASPSWYTIRAVYPALLLQQDIDHLQPCPEFVAIQDSTSSRIFYVYYPYGILHHEGYWNGDQCMIIKKTGK